MPVLVHFVFSTAASLVVVLGNIQEVAEVLQRYLMYSG